MPNDERIHATNVLACRRTGRNKNNSDRGKRNWKTDNSLAQSYFDQADVFMIAISSDEIVIDINKKACEILGYSSNEIKGKNWFDNFVPTAKETEARRLFHDALERKSSSSAF